MKTVAFVLERLGNGGAERVTAALATEFCNVHNLDVHVFTCVKEENEYTLPDGVKRHVMKNTNKGRIFTIVEKCYFLQNEIRSVNPDVVFSLATPKTTIMLSFVSLKRNFKLILSERNDPNRYPKGKTLKLLRNFAYLLGDGMVFQTPDAQAYFSKKIQKKSIIIPNPISENLPQRYEGIRRKVIVNFCRLEPQKNLELLVRAFSKIADEFSDYCLDIYGDGPMFEELSMLIKTLKLGSQVNLRGFASNIHELIVDAALFVSSSNYEGISNSMLEALAIGIPTISTDCPIGGARMIIESGVNGLLVPVSDVNALAEAMRNVLTNTGLSNQLGFNGSKVRSELSVSKISLRWLEFAKGRCDYA